LLKILISGGGVAGVGLACSLSKLVKGNEVSVTILEKDARENVGQVKRGEVIRPEVAKVIEDIGAMDYVKNNGPVINPKPRQEVWHSTAGRLGAFDYQILARDQPLLYLPHYLIVKSLYQKVNDEKLARVIYNARSNKAVSRDINGGIRVNYENPNSKDQIAKSIDCDLLIVAEGGSSDLRTVLGTPLDYFDYEIGYLMAFMEKPGELRWGRHCLAPQGFVGLFSMPGEMMRAAIEIPINALKDWLTASKAEIGKRLQDRVQPLSLPPVRDLGVFYHVIRRHAKSYIAKSSLLIGDAAHTTHPMMGQGMSMVFNDIATLSRLISENPTRSFVKNGAPEEYQRLARPFNESIIQNNEKVFRAFQEIGRDPTKLDFYLLMLEKLGFTKN
jgi:2-octaprenyl-6-methoxyphenol hydroxylase